MKNKSWLLIGMLVTASAFSALANDVPDGLPEWKPQTKKVIVFKIERT